MQDKMPVHDTRMTRRRFFGKTAAASAMLTLPSLGLIPARAQVNAEADERLAVGLAARADVAVKTGDLVAGGDEAFGQRAADKTADAGDENAHAPRRKQSGPVR